MRTKIIVAVILVALAVTASIVTAQGPRFGNRPATAPGVGGPGAPYCGSGLGIGLGPRVIAALNLTQEQIQQLQQLRQDFLAQTQATREQLQAMCKEMAQLWAAENPDATAIKDLAADMDVLRADLRDAAIDHKIAGLNVLTAEQRAKVREKIGKFGCGIGMGCGMGMGPGKRFGPGMGPGPRRGMGMGPGDATGPRAGMGTCPLLNR